MPQLQKRDVVPRIVLTIVTFGLYGLYWLKQITDDVHRISGRPTCTTGGKAALYTFFSFSLYFFYWIYQISDELTEARLRHGFSEDSVKNGLYAVTVICMTFATAAMSAVQMVGDLAEVFAEGDENAAAIGLVALLAGIVVSLLMQLIISAGILWMIYKRSDPRPRIVHILLAVFRTHILTIAFLQASLNDMADHADRGRPVQGNLFAA